MSRKMGCYRVVFLVLLYFVLRLMILCHQLLSQKIINNRSTLTTVRYGIRRQTLSSQLDEFNLLLTPSNSGPLCGNLSFLFQSVSV